jgi:predicted unusual protein kinase regulating ubiquinone biosynthesis (AarF/ABC1/UbiB family)
VLTTSALRTARLLSLPLAAVGLALEGLTRRLTGEDRERLRVELRRRQADRTRRVLGELKGGALKAGQLLSTVEALFPQDPEATWRDALVGLQESNPGLPFAEVEPVLRELGMGRFRDFDEIPAAAASLGQVHRATWEDGRPVAVKVQYPGVREALSSDLRTLSVLTRAAALVAPGMALPPLVSEMRVRLVEELDYLHEARSQSRFAVAYGDDPDILIPQVIEATPRVLVMDWVDGTPLARVAATGTQAERDRAAALYQRFLVSGPARAGLLHTDPHPGNFRLVGDRLGVLDFGSTLELNGMPATFGRLIRALHDRDPDVVLARLQQDGFVRPGVTLDVGKLVDYMAPFTEPARHEDFAFRRDWLRSEFGRVNDPRDPDFAVAMKLTMPAEHLFTHRVWLGMVGVLCQLEATVPVRPVLARWLPGFAPA